MMLRYLSLFSLWLGPVLSFYTAHLRQSCYLFSLMLAMLGYFSALLLLSVLRHFLQFGLACIWPGKSRHWACVGEGDCPVHAAWGRGAASSIRTRMIDTSQTLSLALIGCIELGAMDSCKSNYSHLVEPQTVHFHITAFHNGLGMLCGNALYWRICRIKWKRVWRFISV